MPVGVMPYSTEDPCPWQDAQLRRFFQQLINRANRTKEMSGFLLGNNGALAKKKEKEKEISSPNCSCTQEIQGLYLAECFPVNYNRWDVSFVDQGIMMIVIMKISFSLNVFVAKMK